jgi:uncharacterized protein
MPNALIHETSPYLLQHAHNPVDWLPWCEESFARAGRENKPVFLSIGYSTCHWCHVMEHESFENELTAALMNEHFINIKVDREEMPDIDATYMAFLQATTGHGGWPMSVWLTPRAEPLLGGTYFPPEDRYGRAGFPRILREVARLWREDQPTMRANAAKLLEQLRQQAAAQPNQGGIANERVFGDLFDACDHAFDEELGGFGGAPKFPRPVLLRMLMQLIDRWGGDHADSQRAWQMVERTLRAMAAGGMHDQLGGGFHRYSVDPYWHVPHYEKMLYDQAQLADAYLDAWQISNDTQHRATAEKIFSYLLETLRDKGGAFHAAEDADSLPHADATCKREGAYWTWEAGEISELLEPRAALIFSLAHGVEAGGNARPESDPHEELVGQNTLYRAIAPAVLAERCACTAEEIELLLESAKKVLLEKRALRPAPHRDDKIITAWNALAIHSLARGGAILERADLSAAAREACCFLQQELWDGKLLYRSHRGKRAPHPGGPADYAYLIGALLVLHEIFPADDWLSWAKTLQTVLDREFWSDAHQGYVLRARLGDRELLSVREDYDGAEPAPNHMAAIHLQKMAVLCHEPGYLTRAEALLRGGSALMQQNPYAAPVLLAALDLHQRGILHIQIPTATSAPDGYRPRAVFTHEADATTILVCEDQCCRHFDARSDAATCMFGKL